MSNVVIFDLDGVITSEACYWDAAGLTLHELCYSPRYWNLDGQEGVYQPAQSAEESRSISRAILPEAEILTFKAHVINSNWDTCYAGVCLRLIALLTQLPNITNLLPLRPWQDEWLAHFRQQWQARRGGGGTLSGGQVTDEGRGPWWPPADWGETTPIEKQDDGRPQGLTPPPSPPPPLRAPWPLFLSDKGYRTPFNNPVFQGYIGLGLINRFDAYASEVLGHTIEGAFSRYSPFWTFCQDIFQAWFLGDELYRETYGREPVQEGKPGCIHFERPLLPVERIQATLETLREQGYVLGFATGRVYQEAAYPLKKYGLLSYFDEAHIAPYDYVERAEVALRQRDDATLLGKPHPFQFLVALDQSYADGVGGDEKPEPFVVVGDSTSDILGGRAAGAITVAVLTGARTAQARRLLAESGPDFTLDDMTQVPALLARMDDLATIQHLQFSERAKVEQLLRWWFARHMHLRADSVTLTPKAVSLNSFNGLYRTNGQEYFFKTHVEEQGVLDEYYHAELLEQAGYNVVRPLEARHEGGRQMVIYPVVRWPVMFDLVRAVETGKTTEATPEMLLAAEQRECERLLDIYERTLAFSTAEEHAHAPIHQLFWHRLTGERYKSFYVGKVVPLPESSKRQNETERIAFEDLLRCRWTIYARDGEKIEERKLLFTLGELIERAKVVLNPRRAGMTIIGHGDAHFGNVFLEGRQNYLYFDPAFAGRHTPLLDIVKPLFHNVFATWMYFPAEVAQHVQVAVKLSGTDIYVEHNYALTPIRRAILTTKMEALFQPLKAMLHIQHALPDDWLNVLRLALMCCPLLTVNLLDFQRFPVEISWLGLVQVMQMGHFLEGER